MLVSADTPTIDISGTEVRQIAYRGEPVVTFAMIDKVHGRPDDTANKRFLDNRNRFVEQEDFYLLTGSEIRKQSLADIFPPRTGKGYLLTRRGYLKIAKSLNDDRAWEVFDEMIDRYFAIEASATARLPTTAEAFANVFQMVADQERRQIEQDEQIKAIGARVDQVAQVHVALDKLPSDCEYITFIRKRMNKLYGLSEKAVDTVMRDSPYAPTIRALVKNQHVDASGAHNAGYAKKEVSAVFKRFVGECRMVTATMATHPYIDGRFKLIPQEEEM